MLDGQAPRLLRSSGLRVIPIPARHPDPRDLRATRELAIEQPGTWYVCDGYHFDDPYIAALRSSGGHVAQLASETKVAGYVADVLIDQIAGAEAVPYCHAPWTRVLLGARYAMLRPEFASARVAPRAIPQRGSALLVLMGGSDPLWQTEKVLAALDQVSVVGLAATIVVGARNDRLQSIQRIASGIRTVRVIVRYDPTHIARLMAKADLAISAAGTTCWELCTMGVPSAVLTVAENQSRNVTALEAAGAAVSLGWHEGVDAKRIAAVISELAEDQALRSRLARVGQDLVDGRGAFRVADLLRGTA